MNTARYLKMDVQELENEISKTKKKIKALQDNIKLLHRLQESLDHHEELVTGTDKVSQPYL
jgi:prefoldin subunit 5